MVNDSIRGSTKNTRGMKPDSSFFNRFSRVFKVKHWSFLFLVYSQSHCLYCLHCLLTLERSYSPRRGFRSEGVSRLAFRTLPKPLAVRQPFLVQCQAGLSRWPTMISQILTMSSWCILDRRAEQSSCRWSSVVLRNSSENIVSSIVGICSLVY